METKTWAKFVKSLRERSELNQKEFEIKTRVPLGTLRRWEQSVNTPNLAILLLINYAIKEHGVTVDQLLTDLRVN